MPKCLPIAILLLVWCAHSQTVITGKVVGVTDGDTITLLAPGNVQHKIRIAGIDAPEKGQPFGNRAKQNLSDLVFGKPVKVSSHKKDKYGRLVGKVIVSGTDVGLEQIRAGLAWHYKEYQSEQTREDRNLYSLAEETVRLAGRGLWSSEFVAPWDWRDGVRTAGASVSTPLYDTQPRRAVPKAPAGRPAASPPTSMQTRTYIRGPRGGCYYINSNGNKTYVDRSLCN